MGDVKSGDVWRCLSVSRSSGWLSDGISEERDLCQRACVCVWRACVTSSDEHFNSRCVQRQAPAVGDEPGTGQLGALKDQTAWMMQPACFGGVRGQQERDLNAWRAWLVDSLRVGEGGDRGGGRGEGGGGEGLGELLFARSEVVWRVLSQRCSQGVLAGPQTGWLARVACRWRRRVAHSRP